MTFTPFVDGPPPLDASVLNAALASIDTPLSTGSSAARALVTRFADIINVLDYGVTCNGVLSGGTVTGTDDTTAWGRVIARVTALTAAGVTACSIWSPGGISVVSASLAWTLSDMSVRFFGGAKTILYFTTAVTGNGLTIALTNGSNFVSDDLAIWKTSTASTPSGTGFTITSDVAAGPQQPIKRMRSLEVIGSWSTGALIDCSCVVFDNFYANLPNASTSGYAAIGLYWGDNTNYQTALTINNPLINNASKMLDFSPLTQGLVVNGGFLFDGDYGAYINGTGGILQGFVFNGTYINTTTRGVYMRGNCQDNLFNGCFISPFSAASLLSNFYAFEFNGVYQNTITAPMVPNGGVANTGFAKLTGAPLNNFTGGSVTGCTLGAILIDNASYRNGIVGISGTSNTGAMPLIDASSTINASTPLACNYNGIVAVTPTIQGNTIGLYPNGTANIGDTNNQFNLVGAGEFFAGATSTGFQGIFYGNSGGGALKWVGTNGTTIQAGIVVSGGTNDVANSSTMTLSGLVTASNLTVASLTATNEILLNTVQINGEIQMPSTNPVAFWPTGTIDGYPQVQIGGIGGTQGAANSGTLQLGTALLKLFNYPTNTSYANDTAAATGGVPVGGVYRNGSVLQVRVT